MFVQNICYRLHSRATYTFFCFYYVFLNRIIPYNSVIFRLYFLVVGLDVLLIIQSFPFYYLFSMYFRLILFFGLFFLFFLPHLWRSQTNFEIALALLLFLFKWQTGSIEVNKTHMKLVYTLPRKDRCHSSYLALQWASCLPTVHPHFFLDETFAMKINLEGLYLPLIFFPLVR